MIMIPGAWEPRLRSSAAVEPLPLPLPPRTLADNRGHGPGLETPRADLPGWSKASIFAATLVIAAAIVFLFVLR
jgi:hypothetical protein